PTPILSSSCRAVDQLARDGALLSEKVEQSVMDGSRPRRAGNTAWTMPLRGCHSGRTWTRRPARMSSQIMTVGRCTTPTGAPYALWQHDLSVSYAKLDSRAKTIDVLRQSRSLMPLSRDNACAPLSGLKVLRSPRARRPLTRLYGPAVRCKLNLLSGSDWSCSSVSGPCVEQTAPGHHGYPRASDLILG